CTAFR
ncbi:putative membrane protein, partial [Vibrio parahaemolyticus EKP-028]